MAVVRILNAGRGMVLLPVCLHNGYFSIRFHSRAQFRPGNPASLAHPAPLFCEQAGVNLNLSPAFETELGITPHRVFETLGTC